MPTIKLRNGMTANELADLIDRVGVRFIMNYRQHLVAIDDVEYNLGDIEKFIGRQLTNDDKETNK